MPTTGPGTAHRHKTKTGYWYDRTDLESGDTHEHTFTETPHPADDLTAAEVAALRALLTPVPPTTPPTIPPVPEPPTGYPVAPGTGNIAKALADGYRDLLLHGAVYRDAFGPVERHEVVTLTAYPGERPIIDGTGLGKYHFAYMGLGAVWTIGDGIEFRGFPTKTDADGSSIFGVGAGELHHGRIVVRGTGQTEGPHQRCHLVYLYGTGDYFETGAELLDARGAAVTGYRSTGTAHLSGGRLTSVYRPVIAYSGVIVTANGVVMDGADYEVEKQAGATVNLVSCLRSNGSAVRTVAV